MSIRALIVDDEAPARDELAYLLEAHPDVTALQASTAREALDVIAGGRADLVFQDIHMPGQDGFHVQARAQALEHPPLFVFVTAFDSHAIRAFEENALDYLLKPVSPDRLAKSLDRARKLLRAKRAAESLDRPGLEEARSGGKPPGQDVGDPRRRPDGERFDAPSPEDFPGPSQGLPQGGDLLSAAVERLLSSAGRGGQLKRLAVEQGGRISLIPTAKVVLVEAEEKRLVAVTDAGRLVCHGLHTLARALERLEGLPFFQANRAQIVNLERIAEFAPWFGGKYTVVMNDPARTEVVVSRNRVRDFKARLGI